MTLMDIIVLPMLIIIVCGAAIAAFSMIITLLVLPLIPFAIALEVFEKVKK